MLARADPCTSRLRSGFEQTRRTFRRIRRLCGRTAEQIQQIPCTAFLLVWLLLYLISFYIDIPLVACIRKLDVFSIAVWIYWYDESSCGKIGLRLVKDKVLLQEVDAKTNDTCLSFVRLWNMWLFIKYIRHAAIATSMIQWQVNLCAYIRSVGPSTLSIYITKFTRTTWCKTARFPAYGFSTILSRC